MCDRNCGNCYNCLDDTIIQYEYDKIMSKSLISRINSCNCFMCYDSRSASCVEVQLFTKYNCYNEDIQIIIKQIKLNYKEKNFYFVYI